MDYSSIKRSYCNSMEELKASSEVSRGFPAMPSRMVFSTATTKSSRRHLVARGDGYIYDPDSGGDLIGNWWPLSARSVQVTIDGHSKFFCYGGFSSWTSTSGEESMMWYREGGRKSTKARVALEGLHGYRGTSNRASQNMSRFRMGILPLDTLDSIHREQLHCMGLRICRHLEVGRVLISSRLIDEGEIVIYSKVRKFLVESDDQVSDLVDQRDPSSCYLLVPRLKTLYYNKGTFSVIDPVGSGDLWFLVNHSNRPNLDIVLRKHGIQFRAKRAIRPNEPLVWSYPHSFFGGDDDAVDLPKFILPEDSAYIPE